MNHTEAKGTMNSTETKRKLCSRATEHASRNTTEVAEVKHPLHSGIKLKSELKKKLTVPKPFSFDTGPKIRKEAAIPSPKNSPRKHKGEESPSKITVESIKIIKEIRSSSKTRSVSIERTQKSTKNDNAHVKKPCSRCSRAAKSPTESPKIDSTPAMTVKALKPQVQTSDATKSPRKGLKAGMTPSQPPSTVKLQAHFSKTEKSEVNASNAKNCSSLRVENCKSETSKEVKPESNIADNRDKKPPSTVPNVEVTRTRPGECPDSENPESHPVNGVGTNSESESSSGTDSDPSIGTNVDGEDSGRKNCESGTPKKVSKIPRKRDVGHSGLKLHVNFKKETVPQPFSFDKKENIQNEANQVKMNTVNE